MLGKIIVFAVLSLMASAVCASASTDIVTVANFRIAGMICLMWAEPPPLPAQELL